MKRLDRLAARGAALTLGLVLGAGTAAAQVTYLDADTGNQPGTTNTTFADGTPFTPPMRTDKAPDDNQWWERTGFANEADILASGGGSDSPTLRTTISGLVPGATYNAYTYYWVAGDGVPTGNNQWDITTGLTQAGMVSYLWNDGTQITNPAYFTTAVLITEGNRRLFEIDLGTTVASNAGTIDVYVDDYPGNDDRTWYDGVGTMSVEPGVAYCPGDGVVPHTPCPCVNDNDGSMGGCDWGNLGFPGGGMLVASGSGSIAGNDTFLHASGVSDNFGIFFGADNQVNGGNGNPLNDGLRCAGGALVRLIPPTLASGNQMITPAPVETLDSGAAGGVTRRYQYWFRTPAGPCGQQANLTNGYEIVWLP